MRGELTPLHWAGVGLAAITGGIHVAISVGGLPSRFSAEALRAAWLPISTLLAGIGFFGGITLVVLGIRRRLVYVVGVPFTLAQIVLYVVLNGSWGPLDVFDKVVQVAFVTVLVGLYRREN